MKKIFSLEELPKIADFFISLNDSRVFCFRGDLGTGKTTLIKAIASRLGVPEASLSSPTFGIINIYETTDVKIYHIDLYRIRSVEEVLNLGLEEILREAETFLQTYVFIEWFAVSEPLLGKYYEVSLEIISDKERAMEISLYE